MSQASRILIALFAGVVAGMLLTAQAPGTAASVMAVTAPVGNAWLHALQMVIVPLIVALLVVGIAATAEAARAGRIAARALTTFVVILWSVTIMSAIVTPLILTLWPLPPEWAAGVQQALRGAKPVGPVPGLGAFFDAIVPTNVVAAAAGDAFLPLTIFALAFAFAITRLPDAQRKMLTDLFQAIADAMIVIVGWVLLLAPVGVFALAFGVGVSTGAAAFGALAHYIVVVASVGGVVLLSAYPFALFYARVSPGRWGMRRWRVNISRLSFGAAGTRMLRRGAWAGRRGRVSSAARA